MNHSAVSAGFGDPVHDAQRAFRSVLDALSRPGQRQRVGSGMAQKHIGSAMAQLLLTLTDDGTPVWWQDVEIAAINWLRFHTGAPRAALPSESAFAVITHTGALAALDSFSIGSAESPEVSTMLFVEVPSLDDGQAVEWRGPGIQGSQSVRIGGLPGDFWSRWQGNHALFPQGVDIVFTCADVLVGLPRTTRVRRLKGI
jgi:alpha-D-ribose 1-methylphosphonate 5-triphosphate synthase subunit PhnH